MAVIDKRYPDLDETMRPDIDFGSASAVTDPTGASRTNQFFGGDSLRYQGATLDDLFKIKSKNPDLSWDDIMKKASGAGSGNLLQQLNAFRDLPADPGPNTDLPYAPDPFKNAVAYPNAYVDENGVSRFPLNSPGAVRAYQQNYNAVSKPGMTPAELIAFRKSLGYQ